LRPDLVVRLPGGQSVVVDAKVPLSAFLEAVDLADDGARAAKLREHARQVREHIQRLGQKSYWEQFQPAPEFVVLFLPGETFFSAAVQSDPELIEFGVDRYVIPASPTTLIALLRAAHYGWQQQRVADSAEEIRELGATLYERLRTMASHLGEVGANLERAVASYNKTAGSFESRVLVAARRLKSLGAGTSGELTELAGVEGAPRSLVRGSEDDADR
jgi:DNA recombination protein RmuC